MIAGPVVDQPSRLRTAPGVGPRCRRLGDRLDATRKEKFEQVPCSNKREGDDEAG